MDKEIEIPGSAAQGVPLSHGRCYNDLVFTSGQVSRDIMTGEALLGTIEEETERVLQNLRTVLEAAGSSLECVIKTMVFLTNTDDFAPMNAVYERYFPGSKPGRSTIAIALAGPYKIEIEAVAYRKN